MKKTKEKYSLLRAHKIQIYPNKEQIDYFNKAFGIKRYAFNYGLSRWKELYEENNKPNGRMLRDEFTKLKNEDSSLSFVVCIFYEN